MYAFSLNSLNSIFYFSELLTKHTNTTLLYNVAQAATMNDKENPSQMNQMSQNRTIHSHLFSQQQLLHLYQIHLTNVNVDVHVMTDLNLQTAILNLMKNIHFAWPTHLHQNSLAPFHDDQTLNLTMIKRNVMHYLHLLYSTHIMKMTLTTAMTMTQTYHYSKKNTYLNSTGTLYGTHG